MGPWASSPAQNWVAGVIAWAALTFSLAPLVTTSFPNVTLTQCEYAFALCAVGGLAVAAVLHVNPGITLELATAGRWLMLGSVGACHRTRTR